MNFIRRCLVHAFICFFPVLGFSQIEGPLVSFFSRNTYGAGTQNWAIAMSNNGLMYFGNNKGLLEYDGKNWRLYPLPNRTIVRSIHIDSLGNIFVGGQNEIGVFRNSENQLMKYESLTHRIPESRRDFEGVWQIFSVGNKKVYCSEKEVFVIEDSVATILPQSGRFENYFHVEGSIYLQDAEAGLFLLKEDQLIKVLDPQLYRNDRIVGMLKHGDDLELITRENGIFRLRQGSLKKVNNDLQEFIEEYKAYSFSELANGNLLIGTVLNGIVVASQNGEIIANLNKSKGLENNTILCAMEDKSGNLWLGLDNGINYIEWNSPFNFINSLNGLEGTGYTAFQRDGLTFLGTNQGLFYNPKQEQEFELFSRQLSQIWGHTYLENSIYIHAHEGTFLFENNRLNPISPVQGAWKIIQLKNRPGIWLQGTYEGFFAYTKKKGKGLELLGKLEGFSESARIFEQDENGDIWVSHAYRGLYKIVLDELGTEILDVRRYTSKEGLPSDFYLTVSKIRDEIVFTTSDGIYEFDRENDSFLQHKGLTELIGKDANVLRIIEDYNGNVWFCTDNEFGLISIENSGLYNELQVNYLNEIQEDLVDGFEDVFMLNSSVAFIPVESGFIKFNISQGLQKKFEHDLIFRGVFDTKNADSLIIKNFEENSTLSAEQNNLQIEYVVPTYQNLNEVNYQYRLVGMTNDWSEWSSETDVTFTNLSSGDYTFQVKAMNSHKSETPIAAFSFSILPPWYFSTIAKLGYLFIVIIGLISFYRIVKMREVRKRLDFQEETEETIQRKDDEIRRVSEKSESEIIKLRNEKLKADIRHKNSELASTTMHLVQKSEILLKIKNQLSELSKSNQNDGFQSKIKQIERAIDADVRLDKNWERFESHFDQVHENFFKNLRAKYPNLTPKDQKLCAYLRMNLSTKEIAPLLNISVRGVEISRYRLRKKLDLSPEENLVSFVMEI